ncbi:DUF5793 family protein [Halovivax cerinus]|uniref:DUF5793 family protein n=1 Tax=Halovivax cerinus TaxID=1487865 RepID=A0ABD5NIX5_9EURY|nr:DUF5793 family protein [Halovivax cerinus]
MRREHLTLSVDDVDWVDTDGEPRRPSVTIDCSEDGPDLRDRLTGPDGELLAADETDVALRLQGPVDADTDGVVSVTDRLTGDFVLELNVDADDVLTFITAARHYGERTSEEDGRYEVTIRIDGDHLITYEKQTFLVYDDEGSLLRQRSLIPGGVEL